MLWIRFEKYIKAIWEIREQMVALLDIVMP